MGPVSLEELQARRRSGALLPETYIIERNEGTGAVGAWQRFRDVFPDAPSIPPVPPVGAPLPPPPVPLPMIATPQAHPLFPSAGQAPLHQPLFPYAAAPHAHYPMRKTNPWCAWGFGLGVASFVFAFACGLGLLIAVPALAISILGFAKVQHNREQSGRGLAVAGGVFSALALLIALGFLIYSVPLMLKNHEWTVTEQSSTNSE